MQIDHDPRRAVGASRLGALVALAAVLSLALGALAQSPGADEAELWPAFVTGDDVYVRSGAGRSYYPIGKVHTSDIVYVSGEKFGWMRVRMKGRSVKDFFGFVATDRIRLDADGTTGTTLGVTQVLAPNMDAKFNPDSSWKPLLRMETGQRVRVLDEVSGDRTSVYRIVLPEETEGWIFNTYVRRATDEEVAAWKKRGELASAEAPAATGDATTGAAEDAVKPRAEEPAKTEPAATEIASQPESSTSEVASSTATTTTPPPATTDATETARETEPAGDESPAPAKTLDQVTFDDLESAYEDLKKEPIRTAEIEPLRQRFLAFAEDPKTEATPAKYARARASLLEARHELQQKILELDRLRSRATRSAEDIEATRIAHEFAAEYVAVGRLVASTIYDGVRLPRLLRVTDAGSGRTIAYLEPDGESFDFGGMLGQLVGIVGESAYDGGLRLTMITPRRIDILAARR